MVATKGAEDVAGSAPTFFKRKGNIDPINDPHNTIPTSDRDTVEPTNIQCSP